MKYLIAFVAAVFLAGAAYTAGTGQTRTRTVISPSGLPTSVENTRAALVAAVEARDAEALRKLASGHFSYAVDGKLGGDPIAYWNDLEKKGLHPYTTLARILRMPYALREGRYVWPFAYGTPKSELTAYERSQLGDLVKAYAGNDYYGWRTGITPDGKWSFYVEGD